MTTSVLITPNEILDLLTNGNNGIIFIDSSFKRIDNVKAYDEYLQQHIAGALYLNISDFSLKDSPCPPMLPSLEQFNESVSKLGITKDDHIIVYGVPTSPSIARVVS